MKAKVMADETQIFYGTVDKITSELNLGLVVVGFALKMQQNLLFTQTGQLSLAFYKDDGTLIQEFPKVTLRHHTIFSTINPYNGYGEEVNFTVEN